MLRDAKNSGWFVGFASFLFGAVLGLHRSGFLLLLGAAICAVAGGFATRYDIGVARSDSSEEGRLAIDRLRLELEDCRRELEEPCGECGGNG